MKLLVIFTGGTIGSSDKGEFIGTDENKKYKIIETCLSDRTDIEVITREPYTILSENLMGDNINKLAECISENKADVDGIIVTHGTDTLQYMAAGLELIFSDIDVPIVLVSSNYVIEDNRSNGIANFDAALSYISYVAELDADFRAEFCGVYVSYSDYTYMGGAELHHGALLLPHMAYDDEIFSVNYAVVGQVKCNEFFANGNYLKRAINDLVETTKKMVLSAFKREDAGNKFTPYSDVLWIREQPGKNYLLPKENVKAVLLEGYHSGTLCAENKSLRLFLEDCGKCGIKVFIVGVRDRTPYESTKFFDDYELIILPEISPIFAYMSLWLL